MKRGLQEVLRNGESFSQAAAACLTLRSRRIKRLPSSANSSWACCACGTIADLTIPWPAVSFGTDFFCGDVFTPYRPEAAGGDRPLLAESVSTRARQEADFRCTSQGRSRSAGGEVRQLALPAINRHR